MVNILAPFPDTEEALALLIEQWRDADSLPALEVGGDLPVDLASGSYVFLERIGGSRTRLNDYPTVDVEVFAPGRAAARSLSESIDALILGYPHGVTVGSEKVVIDAAASLRTPTLLPWEDSRVKRYGATYQLSVRR